MITALLILLSLIALLAVWSGALLLAADHVSACRQADLERERADDLAARLGRSRRREKELAEKVWILEKDNDDLYRENRRLHADLRTGRSNALFVPDDPSGVSRN